MLENNLKAAIQLLNQDMHGIRLRPCRTCQRVTELIGGPFGCVLMNEDANTTVHSNVFAEERINEVTETHRLGETCHICEGRGFTTTGNPCPRYRGTRP